MTQPLTRRSTLKAGAHAAWMVPAVQVVSATPAFAASGADVVLALTSPTASYGSDVDGERPDRLSASFSIVNTGADAAESLLVSLVIPGGLYETAPSSLVAAPGYAAGPVSGDAATGWTVSWTRSSPLAPDAPESPTFEIQFNDPLTESPYLRWAGDAFSVGLLATPSNAPTSAVSESAPVAAAALTSLTVNEFGAYFQGSVVTLQGAVQNYYGRRTSGEVTLTFSWDPDPDDDSAWSVAPSSSLDPLPASLTGGQLTGTGTIGDPYTYTVQHAPLAPIVSFGNLPNQEETNTTLVAFSVTFDLGAAPDPEVVADQPRVFTVVATAPAAVAPEDPTTGTTSAMALDSPPPSGGT